MRGLRAYAPLKTWLLSRTIVRGTSASCRCCMAWRVNASTMPTICPGLSLASFLPAAGRRMSVSDCGKLPSTLHDCSYCGCLHCAADGCKASVDEALRLNVATRLSRARRAEFESSNRRTIEPHTPHGSASSKHTAHTHLRHPQHTTCCVCTGTVRFPPT